MTIPGAPAYPRIRLTSLLAGPLVAGLVAGSGIVAVPLASAQTTSATPSSAAPTSSPAPSGTAASGTSTAPTGGTSAPATSSPGASPTQAAAPSRTRASAPTPTTPPSGVRLERVEWKSANRVALWVQSAAMKQPIQVQLLLPANWNSEPDRTFPSLYLLDGLRARDDASGWTLETRISQFFDAKNSIVVLPVGGQSSFYTDWDKDAKGKPYQWETFLMDELPPILARDWRANDDRGVAGLSMGGAAAMMLAERHPDNFRFAGSFSGFLDTTSFGMPQAIKVAMQDAGGYAAEDMWGPLGSQRWADQDPKLKVDKLRDTSVYVSSGSGNTGPWDQPSGLPGIPVNFPGYGLELLSRMTSQTFVNKARTAGVPVTANFRPSGTHTWPYWQFEMTQAWPQYAQAVGIPNVEPACAAGGDIDKLAKAQPGLGPCLTNEYDVEGGRATDFRFGRVFWSQQTGAHSVVGAIGAAYQAEGGPDGALGLPTSDELVAPDGNGRYSLFQNGAIYWSPQTGAHAVRGAIRALWAAHGVERGDLGYPTTDEVANPNKAGVAQGFQNGTVFWSDKTGAHLVKGAILEAYQKAGFEGSTLGYPTSDEIPLRGGAFSRFAGGAIYFSPGTGAHVVPEGAILTAWGKEGYENGRLGYPKSDVTSGPQGDEMQFEHGTIRIVGGKAVVS